MSTTTRHRVGLFNVEFGHPVKAHAAMILERFERERLDVLALEEVQDYTAELARIAAPAGHRVLVIHGRRGCDHVALLVRAGAAVGKVWTFTAGRPYYRVGGGLMAPTQPLAAVVDGITYVVVHAPVHAWVAHNGRHTWTGPARRRGAYAFYMTRLARLFDRHHGAPVAVLGDWNATPATTSGTYSPGWLCRRTGARYARPEANTGHGEIDFGIVRGVVPTGFRVRPDVAGLPRSDHKLVVGTLIYKEPTP